MLLDARDPAVPLDYYADIAVVGAGPAGITLARQLERHFEILLLEAGATEATREATACLAGEISGIDYDLTLTRARVLGGGTNLWAGYCAAFDALDFTARSWVPWSGWPIDAGEVFAHVPDAARLLHLNNACFDAKEFESEGAGALLQSDRRRYQLSVWRFGDPKVDFGSEYRDLLAHSASTRVLTNACATDIHLSESGSGVEYVEVRTSQGRMGRVRARAFVLAAGGIETPRLMLASNRQHTKGVGNASGHVGRWFMEHPHVTITGMEMRDFPGLEAWTGRARSRDGRAFTFCMGFTAEQQAKLGVLNARVHMFRTPQMRETAPPRLGLFCEQAPNAASRVTLGTETDLFGLPRVRLNWQLSSLDYHSHRVLAAALAEDLSDRGLARRRGPVGLADEVLFSNHQLGTTRMSCNAVDGVVDRNCRVHGIQNLFVAGGSVFPTVSWANPTVTVLALTLRLARHLSAVVVR